MAESPLHPFVYDAFQQQAIEVIDRDSSLFVAAPTGSGKTVIADYVIARTLARHRRTIYTAPVKALSNQKFRDFSARYGDQVGIMTGDVTINPRAPILIMTTEIYRNTLLEDIGRLADAAWIIFDEIHYLDDPERGTVWEESILFTPPHIQLLCLSATIPNVVQLAEWICRVQQRPVEVIQETKRSVPLSHLFQCHNTIVETLEKVKQVGYRNRERLIPPRSRYGRRPMHHGRVNRLQDLIRHLAEAQHLPCIFFTFGRRRAEDLALEASGLSLVSPEESASIRRQFDALCERFALTHDRTAEAIGRLIDRGVAYHHAGMLPTMKEVVEQCFTSRLVKLVIATETFALGINMPARSVVLDTLKKRADSGFVLLTRRSFLQMSGRAGRRGMDDAGFAYLRVNPLHVSFAELQRVLHADPEPVQSRFNTTYATLLNLYRRHGRELLHIFPKTFFYFQSDERRRQAGLEAMERKLDLLRAMGYVTTTGLTDKGTFAAWLYGYELLLTELYMAGGLAELDPIALAILMVAVVYEPRPRQIPPRRHRTAKRLAHLVQEPLARIHRTEKTFHIPHKTKTPSFHLTHAMEAWMHQASFAQLTQLAPVDEGEIVRYFRMALQLLRQLAQIEGTAPDLRSRAEKAARKINRDVIDAEAQLRMG